MTQPQETPRGSQNVGSVSSKASTSAPPLAVNWGDVAREWRMRENDTLHAALLRYLAPEQLDLLDAMLRWRAQEPLDKQEACKRMAALFALVAEKPHGPLLLALYTYSACLETWEKSTAYGHINVVLTALAETVTAFSGSGPDDLLLRSAVGLAEAQTPSMATENAFNCSCPVTAQTQAVAVVERVQPVLVQLERPWTGDPELAPVADLLTQDARVLAAYFGCVRDAAAATKAWIDGERDIEQRLDATVRTILEAERGALRNDVYGTEARTHRLALEAFRRAAARPRIHVEDATVTYCYPFSLPLIDPPRAVELARSVRGRLLGGVPVVQADELELTDTWRSSDQRERAYGGVRLILPSLVVTTLDGKEVMYDAEIRISTLGNHYLRLATRLQDADIHVVNQTLRRASAIMGEERIDSASEDWTKVSQYADSVIQGCASVLTELAEQRRDQTDRTVTAHGQQLVVDVERFFTAVLSARSIALVTPDGGRARATGDDLRGAIGYPLLTSPLRPAAVTLEEWVLYAYEEPSDLFAGIGFSGDLGIRTANTTVLYMPHVPSWVHLGYEEMAEFVAALPPLLAGWETRLVKLSGQLDKEAPDLKRRLTALHGPDLTSPPNPTPLYERQFDVHDLEADFDQLVALLHSPRLCQTSSHRRFLDALMESAEIPGLEGNVDRQLTVLSAQHDRLARVVDAVAASHRQERQQREETTQRRLNLLLAFVGVTSLAEMFGWLDNAFAVKARWPWAPWVELAVVAFGIILIVAFILRSQRRARSDR